MAHMLTLSFSSELGDHAHVMWLDVAPHTLQLPAFNSDYLLKLPVSSFNHKLAPLKFGRFFPSKLLSDTQSLPAAMFRVIALDHDHFTADFNHPLAHFIPSISHVEFASFKATTHPAEEILCWAAIETPPGNGRTDFTDKNAFMRDNPANDAEFYATPRKLIHIDGTCASRIAALYAEKLEPGENVLNLMSSWRSHLPKNLGSVIGLGMNEAEMADNPQLDSYLIHDLNQNVVLPFKNSEFEKVVNTVSIEYLLRPVEVLKRSSQSFEIGREICDHFFQSFFSSESDISLKKFSSC